MSFSVIWYSKILVQQIGQSRLQSFLSQFAYGNQDLSGDGTEGGYKAAHLSASLQISPIEQVAFLKHIVNEDLPISAHAVQMTKEILFERAISDERLFGKAGSEFDSNGRMLGWYVGWLESENGKYVFALLMKDLDAFPSKEERQKLVIDLLHSRFGSVHE
jgi:beta-lactamase class D